MDLNHFIPCASVLDMHAILLSPTGEMVYAGPLSGITEPVFNQAKTTLLNPQTLQWVKEKADAAVRGGKVRLT